jgi:hypothetical protein
MQVLFRPHDVRDPKTRAAASTVDVAAQYRRNIAETRIPVCCLNARRQCAD